MEPKGIQKHQESKKHFGQVRLPLQQLMTPPKHPHYFYGRKYTPIQNIWVPVLHVLVSDAHNKPVPHKLFVGSQVSSKTRAWGKKLMRQDKSNHEFILVARKIIEHSNFN